MSRLLVFALQLLIVTVAVLVGAEIAGRVQLIPRALLNLPAVDFSAADTREVVRIFVIACGLAFLANRLISGWDVFDEPRRTAKEIYALVVGVVAAALWLFFLTGINFSPELLLDASVIALLLHLAAFVALGVARRRGARIGGFFAHLLGLLSKPAVWAILLFATSPIVVAYTFTQSRDFANWVTNLRLSANLDDDTPYVIVNALGATTFETPIMAQFADGDPSTLYVLERNGRLYRVDYPSGANKTLLLDLRDGVGYVEMENGALGFDLHPEFGREGSPSAGFVYVYYTEYRADSQTNRLNRYDISLSDEPARTASALPLIAQRRDNDGYHNGGSVEFGPGGFLYLAVGEASMEECHNRIDCALVGGILRIDVDRRGGSVSRPIARQPRNGETANYFIPLDNPYAGNRQALGEFWAHGLRNPFRIAFDPANGNLWAGEVGSTVWEEVDRIERGGNYQFPFIEGRQAQQGFAPPDPVMGTPRGPVLTYRHTAFLRSVIGGIVYRGSRIPEARGRYVFLDNYSGQVMTIPASGEAVEDFTIIARSRDVAQRGPTSFAVAPDGAILITVMGDNDNPTGIVGRLEPADSDAA
ncbi:MAG: PQQ-dependent sugar dehydrogenase, partial [Sphingomonadaceae bacterium]|nr:PQQ-dependent sugar dehydrogenase [Sphingomonadaceae bacterium]